MAERLTMTSDKGGVALTFDLDITCRPSEAQKILKLAEKLKYYEDLAEQGRLIELPCAVGDIVYLFSHDNIHPFTINGFEINKYEVEFRASYCGEEKNLEHWAVRLPVSKICKKVFLTKEEAEAKLKEKAVRND